MTITPHRIYLDYNATTPLDQHVLAVMLPYFCEKFGNPHSSEHAYGWEAAEAVTAARHHVAALIGGMDDEIIFTSGATEANNLAVIGTALKALRMSNRRKIIISSIEHKCILGAAKFTQSLGFQTVYAPVNSDGIVDLDRLSILMDSNVLLVSIMATNNEIGVIQPLKSIGELCAKHGALFHTDAAQATYMPIDVTCSNIDMLSLSAHKLYGPKGIGALYINQQAPLKPDPILHGGGQQNGFRSGTVPVPLAVGFGEAATMLHTMRLEEGLRIKTLRTRLLDNLINEIGTLTINGSMDMRHPGNLNITFPGIDIKQFILGLQPRLAISSGSACTSGIPEPSHVLKAIGLTTEQAEASFRLAVGRFTTVDEVDTATKYMADRYHKTCEIS